MEPKTSQAAEARLLATFYIRDALCALDAASVQEVIRLGLLTPAPHAPEEVSGIINLRGRIVTIVDAGLKLGFGRTPPDRESRVFIIEDRGEYLGLLVDRVAEVVELESSDWNALPANISAGQARYFKGVARAGGRIIALLNASAILDKAR
jgi:purine-binding chemotaxis protein CheW